MNEMHILADDLTGALDTAAAFAGEVPVYLDVPAAVDVLPCPVSAVATATRDVPADSLPRLLAPSLPWLVDAELAFKKVDSLLRGNTFAECAHVARAGGFERIVFAARISAARARHHRRPAVCRPAWGAARAPAAGRRCASCHPLLGAGIDGHAVGRAVPRPDIGVDSRGPLGRRSCARRRPVDARRRTTLVVVRQRRLGARDRGDPCASPPVRTAARRRNRPPDRCC